MTHGTKTFSRKAWLVSALLMGSCAMSLSSSAQPAKDDTASAHIAKALKITGTEHVGIYNTTCGQLYPRVVRLVQGKPQPPPTGVRPDNDRDQATWQAKPAKVFDNVYWLGEHNTRPGNPAAWAIDTTDGIIIIDALHANSIQHQVVDGLKSLGLDPKRIKYVLVTHAHTDHFGGAKYLQDTFGARVMMGANDWEYMTKRGSPEPMPKRDITIKAEAGEKFTLGKTTMTLYLTPGHTPGTVSILLPVTDKGVPHLAAMWGGSGMPFDPDDTNAKKLQVATLYHNSVKRFGDIAEKAGADILFANHPYLDLAEEKNAKLAKRGPNDPNPYVIGKARTKAYMDIAVECTAAGIASFGK